MLPVQEQIAMLVKNLEKAIFNISWCMQINVQFISETIDQNTKIENASITYVY